MCSQGRYYLEEVVGIEVCAVCSVGNRFGTAKLIEKHFFGYGGWN